MAVKKFFAPLIWGLSLLLLWTYIQPATGVPFEPESPALSVLPSANVAKAAEPESLVMQPVVNDTSPANLPATAPQKQISGQAVAVITANADSFLSSFNPDNNAGGADDIAAGVAGAVTGGSSLRRGVIKFDIAGSGIPAGSTIDSVSLSLDVVRWPTTLGVDSFFTIHRITTDWNEGNKTGNAGVGASTGEVTWNSAKHSQTAWGTAGGDFVGTVSATSNSIVQACLCSYTWGSTAQMVSDVQGWLDSPSTNFGWLLKNAETTPETVRRFAADEHATATPPTLTINYTPPSANLSISKSDSPDPVDAGENLVYTLSVANAGPNTATSLVVTDTLPSGVGFVSATGTGWSCNESSGTVVCTRASLGVTTAPNILITVTAPDEGGSINNSATVSSSLDDSSTGNNTDSIDTTVTAQADLSLTKSDSPDPVGTGDTFTYTLSVANAGPSSATSLTVTDTLPTDVVFDSASGTGWVCNESSGTVTCTRASLGVASAPDILIMVTAPTSTGTITNSATVGSAVADPSSSNDTDQAATRITSSGVNVYLPLIMK